MAVLCSREKGKLALHYILFCGAYMFMCQGDILYRIMSRFSFWGYHKLADVIIFWQFVCGYSSWNIGFILTYGVLSMDDDRRIANYAGVQRKAWQKP